VLEAEITKLEEEFKQLVALLPDQREIPGLLDSGFQACVSIWIGTDLLSSPAEQMHDFYATIPVRVELNGQLSRTRGFSRQGEQAGQDCQGGQSEPDEAQTTTEIASWMQCFDLPVR